MNIVNILANALRQADFDSGHSTGSGLRRGWDYWLPELPPHAESEDFSPKIAVAHPTIKPDTDGNGMARLPHAHLLRGEPLPAQALPVLDLTMDIADLRAGVWRQCLIRPADDSITEGSNPFRGRRGNELCTSSRHMMALLGHPPRDLVIWLDDLRRRDPALFRLVLAKDFRGAIETQPDIIDEPWPHAVRTLWRDDEGDFLSPFRVAILYAEIARLAMNQAGLLDLAFDGKIELTTKRLLDRIATSCGPATSRAADRAIAHAPYQTLALTPPAMMLANKDVAAIAAWANTAASSITLAAGLRGGINIMPVTPAEAAFLRDGFAAHLQNQPEPRSGHGSSFQPRGAASLWGLNWRLNAAVGMLEIAESAREWNLLTRPNGLRLPDTTPKRSANPVARAIMAIRFRWLAEHNPSAALTVLGETLTKKQKNEEQFKNLNLGEIDPLTIDLYLGDKSGLDLLAQAWKAYRQLPGPTELGYTARSQAHLWLDTDGDDIDHYRRCQAEAVSRHQEALAGVLQPELRDSSRAPPEAVALLAGHQAVTRRRRGIAPDPSALSVLPMMTYDPAAAVGAQLQGQMISPWSLDPIHARGKRQKS
ncbi:MAG: hypothetical protein KGJ57_21800 [Sphingomonadales bacterium]|nr:hypothetical protein [Sphingomonadales bacterium]MDE2172028.1 hypothetical protein [Sphingomonadales bacterium]